MEERQPEKMRRSVLVAFALVVTTGIILALSTVVDVPVEIALVAALGFLLSAVAVGVLVTQEARQDSVSFLTAMGRGAKASLRWVWAFLP